MNRWRKKREKGVGEGKRKLKTENRREKKNYIQKSDRRACEEKRKNIGQCWGKEERKEKKKNCKRSNTSPKPLGQTAFHTHYNFQ